MLEFIVEVKPQYRGWDETEEIRAYGFTPRHAMLAVSHDNPTCKIVRCWEV